LSQLAARPTISQLGSRLKLQSGQRSSKMPVLKLNKPHAQSRVKKLNQKIAQYITGINAQQKTS